MFESEKLKMHEGKLYGPYRAKVINNKDKNKLCRIKVECPSVYGDGIESPWCFAMMPFAGNTYGFFAVPSVGDFVWIFLEKGSPDFPVWIGSPYTNEVPNELKKTKTGKDRATPNVYGIRTPSGHAIVLDDDSESSEIRLLHKSGSSIVMHADGSIRMIPLAGKKVYVNGTLNATAIETVTNTVSGNESVGGKSTVGSLATDGVNISATSITASGNINTVGNVTAENVTGNSDVVGGGKSLKSHTHGGVATGSGSTGAPQ